jgi:hypothetical protein
MNYLSEYEEKFPSRFGLSNSFITNKIYHIMGAVFRPKDLGRANRKIVENAVKDFSPDAKDSVIKLLNS